MGLNYRDSEDTEELLRVLFERYFRWICTFPPSIT